MNHDTPVFVFLFCFVCLLLFFFVTRSYNGKVHGKDLMEVENIECFSRVRQPFPLYPG